MLTEGFDNIEARPFTSGGFADVYKATYKGQPVVAKALKTTAVDDLENVHKVCGFMSRTIAQSVEVRFSAVRERGCGMEMASTRKHPTVRWGYLDTTALFDGLRLDGEWKHYELHQDRSGS
jgi:hypothetical protein